MVIDYLSKAITTVFGSRNDRLVKAYRRRVEQVNALEPAIRQLTDIQLKAKTEEFRQRIKQQGQVGDLMNEIMAVAREAMDRSVGIRNIFNPEAGFNPAQLPDHARKLYEEVKANLADKPPIRERGSTVPLQAWHQVEVPNELYNAVREIYPHSRPPFRARPFDVQIIGGVVLGEGKIAEMKTGEGKTIVAPLACYVACLEHMHCHVVTVNDYLVQRDRDWVFPFYHHLGLSVGAIHPQHMQPTELKQEAYSCDVVYGTNSEFGFDYLRDNMKMSVAEQVQRRRDFVIIDEVDSILIDEARTPLIISGPAFNDQPRYELADKVARHLINRQREWDAADAKVQQTVMRIKGLEGDIRNTRDKNAVPAMKSEMKELQSRVPVLEQARDKFTQYYEVEREKKATHLTHNGVAEAQKVADIGSFYVGANMDFPHLLENALRAHAVYTLDKDYVVQQNPQSREQEVIIVDEFTGRLMIGRQWSDGLHQAVEAKERVKIKEETQTFATVTIQNFFKLYKRRAGMTGTAITEATEFDEIYNMDVVCIPTNVPVVRADHDDLVYLSQKDKWESILDEIKRIHDLGRPVLVGTTSVENSQLLSNLLTKKHGIKHEVLNAKQHEREALIVQHAGELGAVMIATNMAGRGTDIKLAPIDRAALLRHWQQRGLLSRDARPEMSDEEIVGLAYRHIARNELGLKPAEIDGTDVETLRLQLLRKWAEKFAPVDPAKAPTMSAQECTEALDRNGDFLLHKLAIYSHIEQMGGLYILGTERHEARRIDNQLRGRAGRQGDRGSSRFIISLEDDLMKLFAGNTTLNVLSKLGMKEGDAIEHPWITKSVQRAQRKVEERNYQIRKQLLEYDEVMEHQRNAFYSIRQDVLEGKGIESLIFNYITDAVDDAAALMIHKDYVGTQCAEWVRQNFDVIVEAYKLRTDNLDDLKKTIVESAKDDSLHTIEVTLGEYIPTDAGPEDHDLRGLSEWAKTRFELDLAPSVLRGMSVDEVKARLREAAIAWVDKKDVSGVARFLDPQYASKDLAEWTRQKFGFEVNVAELDPQPGETQQITRDRVVKLIVDRAQDAYRKREVMYPIEFALDYVFQVARHDGAAAAAQLSGWVNQRYELGWGPEQAAKLTGTQLVEELSKAGEEWLHGGKLDRQIDEMMSRHGDDVAALGKWASQRFLREVAADELRDPATRREKLVEHGRAMFRTELTQLERYLLLQILDTAWKDHLYGMDHLKDSVGLQGYAERDPRIVYKREGSLMFQAMQRSVRDRVTELIFRARLNTQVQEARDVYGEQHAEHVQAPTGSAAIKAAATEDGAAPAEAGSPGESEQVRLSRKARRAASGQDEDKGDDNRPEFKDRKRKSR